MLQSIVEPSAFNLACHYVLEKRVRLIGTDEARITASITGHSGMHEQTLVLQNGALQMECSCPLTELPMCRHCLAVLLEYLRWPKQHAREAGSAEGNHRARAHDPVGSTAAQEVNLGDLTLFVAWLRVAAIALHQSKPLPVAPELTSTEVRAWVEAIKLVEAQRRTLQAEQLALKTDLGSRDQKIFRLHNQLQAVSQDIQTVRVAGQALRKKVDESQEPIKGLSGQARELHHFADQIKSVADVLTGLGSNMDSLISLINEFSAALDNLSKSPPS